MKEGFFTSHDGELHLGRIPAFSREIIDLQLPVRWSASLNYGYGTPIFIIMYPLPYYMAFLPYTLGFGAIGSLKIVILASIVLSSVFMWMFIYSWTKSLYPSLLASLIYALLPYRIFNIFVRAALGEIVIMIFPPLILLATLMIGKSRMAWGGLLLAFSVAGLILSHNSSALLFVPTLIVISLLLFKDKLKDIRIVFAYIVGWSLGLIMSASYWLPAVVEKKYTLITQFLSQKSFSDNFLHPLQLIATQDNDLPIKMGVISVIIILYAAIRMNSHGRRLEIFGLFAITVVTIFFTLPVSNSLWASIPLMPYFQLPWRFLNITVLTITLLVAIFTLELRRKFLLTALVLVIGLIDISQYIFSTNTQFKDDTQFEWYPGDTAWHQEGIPLWTAGSATSYPEEIIELTTDGQYSIVSRTSTQLNISVDLTTTTDVIFHQVYFPGWKAYINHVEVPIEFQDIRYRGLMKITAPEGHSSLNFTFSPTKVRRVADILSIIGLSATIPYYFWLKHRIG